MGKNSVLTAQFLANYNKDLDQFQTAFKDAADLVQDDIQRDAIEAIKKFMYAPMPDGYIAINVDVFKDKVAGRYAKAVLD